jgi:hypothetical protein
MTDMFSLATIQRMNAVAELRKQRRRARAMNAKVKAHPKNAEKTGAADAATNRYLQDNDQ